MVSGDTSPSAVHMLGPRSLLAHAATQRVPSPATAASPSICALEFASGSATAVATTLHALPPSAHGVVGGVGTTIDCLRLPALAVFPPPPLLQHPTQMQLNAMAAKPTPGSTNAMPMLASPALSLGSPPAGPLELPGRDAAGPGAAEVQPHGRVAAGGSPAQPARASMATHRTARCCSLPPLQLTSGASCGATAAGAGADFSAGTHSDHSPALQPQGGGRGRPGGQGSLVRTGAREAQRMPSTRRELFPESAHQAFRVRMTGSSSAQAAAAPQGPQPLATRRASARRSTGRVTRTCKGGGAPPFSSANLVPSSVTNGPGSDLMESKACMTPSVVAVAASLVLEGSVDACAGSAGSTTSTSACRAGCIVDKSRSRPERLRRAPSPATADAGARRLATSVPLPPAASAPSTGSM